MSSRAIDLAAQRGRLQERIAAQRAAIAANMVPIAGALAAADDALAAARRGVDYVKGHPLQVGLAVAVLAALRPKRVWRWGRRAFFAWGLWRKLHMRLATFGPAHRAKASQ